MEFRVTHIVNAILRTLSQSENAYKIYSVYKKIINNNSIIHP